MVILARYGKVQHYQARKLKVKTSPKLDVMADGVALGRGTVTIKVRPGAMRVIAPEPGMGMEKPQEEPSVAVEGESNRDRCKTHWLPLASVAWMQTWLVLIPELLNCSICNSRLLVKGYCQVPF